MIIHDIYTTRTFAIEFLCRSKRHWFAKEQTGPGATSVDLVFIEESKEDEVVEQQFVEAQTTQTNIGEENVIEVEVQTSIEV
jgi:hypothetical protein